MAVTISISSPVTPVLLAVTAVPLFSVSCGSAAVKLIYPPVIGVPLIEKSIVAFPVLILSSLADVEMIVKLHGIRTAKIASTNVVSKLNSIAVSVSVNPVVLLLGVTELAEILAAPAASKVTSELIARTVGTPALPPK